MDDEQLNRDDPRAISRSEQQRAEVLDHLRTAEDFIVFYRHKNEVDKGPTLVTQITKGDVFNWIACLIEEIDSLLRIAGEAYMDVRQQLAEKQDEK
jgi:hypothetical protein